MVCNTQNYWVSALCLSSGILNTTFRKLGPFPSSGEGRKTPTLLGPLERVNLNHWTSEGRGTPTLLGPLERVDLSHWTSEEKGTPTLLGSLERAALSHWTSEGRGTPTLLGSLERVFSSCIMLTPDFVKMVGWFER
jgi:hypothetical protein